MKGKIFLILLLNLGSNCFAQKQGSNWYFGTWSAISFNSGNPINLSSTSMFARWGSATISSASGRLLLYSNGNGVWDSSHKQFASFKLDGYINSPQPALFIPWPDSTHLYYILIPQNDSNVFFKYNLINMKLRGGLGDIVNTYSYYRLPTIPLGKINAVRHPNKRDYWLAIPQANTDSLHIYLITPKGIVLPPIKSKVGIYFKPGINSKSFGYIKFSPNGRKICNIGIDTGFVADFDPINGKLSNIWKFRTYGGVSLEFSPKSRFLYVCNFNNRISQYDLNTTSQQDFFSSRITIDSVNYLYQSSCLQIALDGKIYITSGEYYGNPNPIPNPYFQVIHSPDSMGKKARVERNCFYIGSQGSAAHTGLPDFIQSFFHKPNFGVRQNCANDTVFFTIKDTYELDSVHWDFGDAASGTLNGSLKTTNVFHYYKKLGNYKARLISFHKSYTDTIYETFLLKPLKPNLGKDTNFCKAKYLLLTPDQEYAGYKWSNSQTSKSTYVTNPGTYYLTVSDYSGCKGSDTIVINKPIISANFTVNDFNQCLKSNDFALKETTDYKDGLRRKSFWIKNDTILNTDTMFKIVFNNEGNYAIKLVAESYGGCRDSITKILTVSPNVSPNFNIKDTIECFKNNSFNYTNTTTDTGKISYQWDLGDQTFSNQKNITAKTYLKDSSYRIQLISTTDNNCKDTATKIITLKPSPKADFTWDIACSRTVTNFKYTGSKPVQSFHWNFNNEATSSLENPSHKFAAAGTSNLTLALTSTNGCTDTLKKTIDIKPQSQADFTAQDVCENRATDFVNTSKGATSYTWKFGDGNTTNLPSPKHQYQISGKSTTFNVTLVALVANGCSDSVSKATTVNANPKSDFSYTTGGKQVIFTATETAATQYQWTFGDGGSTNTATPKTTYNYTKFPSGKYTACLKVINAANCFSESCKEIVITGAVANFSEKSFKIYPNPNNGSFTIEIENPQNDGLISIYNTIGMQIKTIETNSSQSQYLINLDLSSGLYSVKMESAGKVFYSKFIKL